MAWDGGHRRVELETPPPYIDGVSTNWTITAQVFFVHTVSIQYYSVPRCANFAALELLYSFIMHLYQYKYTGM